MEKVFYIFSKIIIVTQAMTQARDGYRSNVMLYIHPTDLN